MHERVPHTRHAVTRTHLAHVQPGRGVAQPPHARLKPAVHLHPRVKHAPEYMSAFKKYILALYIGQHPRVNGVPEHVSSEHPCCMFILAEILVLAGGAIVPAPGVPASTRISAKLNMQHPHAGRG